MSLTVIISGARSRSEGVAASAKTETPVIGDPPPTHAWFIAARGDLALAVVVEHGASGSGVAAPVAARFLRAYDAGR